MGPPFSDQRRHHLELAQHVGRLEAILRELERGGQLGAAVDDDDGQALMARYRAVRSELDQYFQKRPDEAPEHATQGIALAREIEHTGVPTGRTDDRGSS